MRALPAASRGCIVVYTVETWTRPRRDRDGVRVPARLITTKRSGTVWNVRHDGIFDVVTGNGFAFVSPASVVNLSVPKETR